MEKEARSDFRPFDRTLIAALVAASSAWFLHLLLSDLLAPESCDDRSKMILHIVTVCCLAIAGIAAGVAWRARGAAVDEPSRWNATITFVLSLGFLVVILAQEIPNLLLRSCD